MPLLVVEKGPDKGKAIPIPSRGTVLVGRDSATALPLRDTMTSRMHAKIEDREDGYWIDDLGSMNGTYVNGSKIREAQKLAVGDLIKIGETLFTFQGEESAATTLAGNRIGGYRILERLGRGGMGTVYKAEQIDLQRLVALKVISEEHTKDKEFIELFIHEARAAAKLNHPNIVQVYDVKRHGELYYFSMEYVSGGSVQDVLNKQRKVPHEQAVRWILDAARGLDHAHGKGIMHRDVKPDNLMIAETGLAKIGDMGLARGLNEKIGPEEETSVIGTPHYIAPEQVLGRPADFRCDIYSLGATAYRMIAGTTPFQAPSVRDLVNKKVREDAPTLHQLHPEVPKPVSDIVSRMMIRDPDKRYQGMSEVVASLDRVSRGAADAAEGRGSRPIETLVGNRKLLLAAAGLLIVLVVGGVLGAFLLKDGGAGTVDPGPKGPDLNLAAQMLENAKLFERTKMNAADPRSVEKAIAEYSALVDQFPGSAPAAKAAEYRAVLQRTLREAKASQRLKEVQTEDEAAWKRFLASLPGRPDPAPAEEAEKAYEAFARSEDAKGTAAADEASKRAEHIRRWSVEIQRQHRDFAEVQERARLAKEANQFRKAWDLLSEMDQAARRAAMECDFAKDRYRSMHLEAAGREALAVLPEARTHWKGVDQEARGLAREKNYEGALKLLDEVIRDSVEEVVREARDSRKKLEEEWLELTRREREAAEEARRVALAKARAAYAQVSLGARDLVLKFDFKGALARLRAFRDESLVDEFKERLDRRILELERCVHFKDSLVNVVNARDAKGTNPHRFRKEYDTITGSGTIESADDRGIRIRLTDGGGSYDQSWTEFTGRTFADFVRKQWKYDKAQNSDPNDRCDLAAICMEFGLYEDALSEIDAVLLAMKDPGYSATETVRKFCEDYKARLSRGESAEYSEVEAQKRLARLDLQVRARDWAAARAEIDVLRARYGKSAAVTQSQSKIEETLELIRKEGGEQLNRMRQSERLSLLLARVSDEQSAARKAQADVVQRLGRIDDAFERNVHLGAAYAAAGEFRVSTEKFLEAKRVGELMLMRRDVGREFLPYLGAVYAELFRNAVLMKDKKNAQAIKNEGSARFVSPETKTEEEWWTRAMSWYGTWSEVVLPQEEKKYARLKEELRANPEDPQKLWALAQTCAEGTHNLAEARGHLAYLLEHHPEFPQVTNGNCLYRLAETLFAFREVREAAKRYQELAEQNKEHAKVADGAASDGVKKRLDECYRLIHRMGYPRSDKGR
jgi:serine/threonine-protein kinase